MLKTFCILIKKIRFYVFIVSAFFMIQTVVLEYQYKTEYNRILGEYKQHQQDGTDYAFVGADGYDYKFHPLSTIYKDEIENIMKHQLGEDYIYDTYTKAANTFVLAIVPFIVSLFMCAHVLLKDKLSKIDGAKVFNNVALATGAITMIVVFIFIANAAITVVTAPSPSEEFYRENKEAIDTYRKNHKDDWNGYKGTRRNSWAEDEKLKQDGYDPKEYRKKHGYKYYD